MNKNTKAKWMLLLAESLGLEFGQKFSIKNSRKEEFYQITENGLRDNWGVKVRAESHIIGSLMLGEDEIEKKKWDPYDDGYYTIDPLSDDGTIYIKTGERTKEDERCVKRKLAFETWEEAHFKAEEMGIKQKGEES